jgi:Aspartyl/Asparaginyl beta-hydroxylase
MLGTITIKDRCVELAENRDLAEKLRDFFAHRDNHRLWNIDTGRQRRTKELRYTQHIPLRSNINIDKAILLSTNQWNQVTDIVDGNLLKIPIFQTTYNWLLKTLGSLECDKQIVLGRVFFSKHLSNSMIDNHIDAGDYFDKYWFRLHFVVESNAQNIFHIDGENIILEKNKLYWINNHVPHWLCNGSSQDRINLIADIMLV